jgi:hypothetical protein
MQVPQVWSLRLLTNLGLHYEVNAYHNSSDKEAYVYDYFKGSKRVSPDLLWEGSNVLVQKV